MKRCIASLLCMLLLTPGCATNHTPRVQTPPQGLARDAQREVLAGFAAQMRIGTRVKATIAGNHVVRGTLVKRTDQGLVIQPRTRIAEPLVEVPFDDLLALEQEVPSKGVTGRAIATGAAVGIGATFGFFFLLAALLGGS